MPACGRIARQLDGQKLSHILDKGWPRLTLTDQPEVESLRFLQLRHKHVGFDWSVWYWICSLMRIHSMPCGLLPEPNSLLVRNRMHEQKQTCIKCGNTCEYVTYLYVFIGIYLLFIGRYKWQKLSGHNFNYSQGPGLIPSHCSLSPPGRIVHPGRRWLVVGMAPPDWSNTVPRVSPTEAPPSCLQRAICCRILHWFLPIPSGKLT